MNTFKHLAMTVTVTLFVLSFNLTAQMNHDSMKPKGEQKSAAADTSLCNQSMNDMSQKMGKPTFEQLVSGLRVQVWLITQEEHKKMMDTMMKDSSMGGEKHEMSGMKHGDMKMDQGMQGMDMKNGEMGDKGMMEAMMSGTHHIMTILAFDKSDDPVKGAAVEVAVLSPSQKTENVRLRAMKGHFGGGLNLNEKGDYVIDIKVNLAGKYRNARFVFSTN